jgi:hypothetical protein
LLRALHDLVVEPADSSPRRVRRELRDTTVQPLALEPFDSKPPTLSVRHLDCRPFVPAIPLVQPKRHTTVEFLSIDKISDLLARERLRRFSVNLSEAR